MERLEKLALELKELNANLSRITWVQYTVGYDFGIEEAYKKVNDFLEDNKNYAVVCD